MSSAPKRPLSPFIFYSQDARRIIKKENPGLHSKLIMKQVQKNWRAMSEEQKEFYKDQSKINRNEYEHKRRTFDAYKANNPDTNKLSMIKVIQERRLERQAKKEEQEQLALVPMHEEEELRREQEFKRKLRKEAMAKAKRIQKEKAHADRMRERRALKAMYKKETKIQKLNKISRNSKHSGSSSENKESFTSVQNTVEP